MMDLRPTWSRKPLWAKRANVAAKLKTSSSSGSPATLTLLHLGLSQSENESSSCLIIELCNTLISSFVFNTKHKSFLSLCVCSAASQINREAFFLSFFFFFVFPALSGTTSNTLSQRIRFPEEVKCAKIKQQNVLRFSSPPVPPLHLTLNVLDVELGDLAREVVLLDGLGARNRERKPPLKVLHLVHGTTEQALKREGGRERSEMNTPFHVRNLNHTNSHHACWCEHRRSSVLSDLMRQKQQENISSIYSVCPTN